MTLTSKEVLKELTPFEFAGNRKVAWNVLRRLLPDFDTALFFAKLYELDYTKLSELISTLFQSDVINELMKGTHSTELQDYLIDVVPNVKAELFRKVSFTPPEHATILPAMWDYIDLQIADSLKEVANKLVGTLDALPSKEGKMLFKHMAKLNKQRPTIGTYQASIQHELVPDVLIILDVSGSMTETTVSTIIGDVIALAWKSNAHLAIVSDKTFYWAPGTYTVDRVMQEAEFGGTHYETLVPLFQNRNWGTVITIADYDSSYTAQNYLNANGNARVGKVLDISLVNRPTFLAECVGQFADEVEPILVSNTRHVLGTQDYW